MSTNDLRAGVSHHASKDDTDDDGVVGVTEDRDDVGHEVDRQRQVGEEQEQSDTYSSSKGAVAGESVNESGGVGHDASGIAQS